jgi:hypothetical protein
MNDGNRLDRREIGAVAAIASIIAPALFSLGWLSFGLVSESLARGADAELLLGAPLFILAMFFFALVIAAFTAFPLGLVLGLIANRMGATGPLSAMAVGGATGGLLVLATAVPDGAFGVGLLLPFLIFAVLGMISAAIAYRLNFGRRKASA